MCLLPSSHISQYLHSQGAHVYIFISGSKSSFAACSHKEIFLSSSALSLLLQKALKASV